MSITPVPEDQTPSSGLPGMYMSTDVHVANTHTQNSKPNQKNEAAGGDNLSVSPALSRLRQEDHLASRVAWEWFSETVTEDGKKKCRIKDVLKRGWNS